MDNLNKGVALNAYMTANDAYMTADDAYNASNDVVNKKGTIANAASKITATNTAAMNAKTATDDAILVMLPGIDKGLARNASKYTVPAVTAANNAVTAANEVINKKADPKKAATAAATTKQKTSNLLNYFNKLIGLK
jgi:hypothetical protein